MTCDFTDTSITDTGVLSECTPHDSEVLVGAQFSAADVALCSSDEARTFLPSAEAVSLVALPLALVRSSAQLLLHIAVADESDRMRTKLQFLCGLEVALTRVPQQILEQAIPKAYFGSELRLRKYIDRIAHAPRPHSSSQPNALTLASSPAVPLAKGDAAQFVTAILEFAAVREASDLHISPGVDTVVVKMRIDGELCCLEGNPYDKSFHEQVVSRLKVLAALDLTNRRLPQDGAFRFAVGATVRSARVSTLPSVYGESVVIRFLDGQAVPEIGSLGLAPATLQIFRRVLEKTEGLILLTGPTGSGKTTTMYSLVRELARRGRHVVTVEDPVENPVTGMVQVQVCTEQGLDYPRAIRSVLRHDPDVLLIGEMRDGVSAAMALDAASTGHLTVSSLHVGSSLQAINRLEVLGVSRTRSIPAVALIVNQRLVPKLCSACKRLDTTQRTMAIHELCRNPQFNGALYQAVGCSACSGSGYRGRVLVTELLDLQSERAKDACYRATTTTELLDLLPVGAALPWTESLQHQLLRGEISLAQIEEFAMAEMR